MLFVFCWPCLAVAQVEHNFEMKPENTDCHELPQSFESAGEGIQFIRSATFRVQQSVKISRYHIPRSASFHSCDGKTGYLIAEETEGTYVLYSGIPQDVWQNFINSNDPIGFYEEEIKKKHNK